MRDKNCAYPFYGMHYNKIVGNYGEGLARNFLARNGYEILDRNIKIGYKEIDIVAKKDDEIVFIEVKTRTSEKFGAAEEGMDDRKIGYLSYAILSYLKQHKYNDYEVSFDLIAVNIDKRNKTARIKHYKKII